MKRNLHETIRALASAQTLRRAAAFVLCFVMCLQQMPVLSLADDWTNLEPANRRLSQGRSVANTYILEITNGSRRDGDVARNVLYFALEYIDVNGMRRNVIVLPQQDGPEASLNAAAAAGTRSKRIQNVKNNFGVEIPEFSTKKLMSSNSTDQIVFTTPAAVKRFTKIQIFGKATSEGSEWDCRGMRIYQVEQFYGLEMYGWYSADAYLDFKGKILAEAVMIGGSGMFYWNNSGGTYNIVTLDNPNCLGDIVLVNDTADDSEKTAFEASKHYTTHVGMEHDSQMDKSLVFRIDFADQGGAGFESQMGSYWSGSQSTVEKLMLSESASLNVSYLDVYNTVRTVSLPLMVNALGPVLETMGNDIAIAGYAQQGDSIAVPMHLPDYQSVTRISLNIGAEEASESARITLDSQGLRGERVSNTETDDISYTFVALYEDVDVKVSLDGAMLRYSFEAGENNPVKYETATVSEGITLRARQDNVLSLQSYSNRISMRPIDRQDRYLVTMTTDNVVNAGTTSDVILQFTYISIKDKELTSAEYNVRDYVRQFYGDWPGSVDDFAYKYGLRSGGTVQFILPLAGVQQITGVSFRLKGQDEWQVSGLTVHKILRSSAADGQNGIGIRRAEWTEVDGDGIYSHLLFTRTVNAPEKYFSFGQTVAPGTDLPPAGSDDWKPGTLIQDDGTSRTFDGESAETNSREEIEWDKLRHYMTYGDAQQDLGFTKKRCEYTVSVKVARDVSNPNNDDCGSKNLFYFQLIFENGNSGCTLANQQIVGDAFRTGAISQFRIPTSQDYGELTAVRVIPDDQDGNGDIYDKLKIEYIEVKKETEDALSPTWTARGEGEDGLGWVGIEYRDPGELGSNLGAQGHSISELATTYQINESSYEAKFLISITTGPYLEGDEDPYTGGITMSYSYFDSEGRFQTANPVDIIQLMNEYSGRTGSKVRRTTVSTEPKDVNYYVSDPSYNFRPGTTDKFFLSVKDISQFVEMRLQLRSDVVTRWNISDFNISLVNGHGTRFINANGEYDYRYPDGLGVTFVTEWMREENLVRNVEIYRAVQNTAIAEIAIPLKDNPVQLSEEASKWVSIIPREPSSKDDVLNLFVYPTEGDMTPEPDEYRLLADVRYTDAMNKRPMQISAGSLQRGEDENGNAVFYALGLNANYMEGLSGVDIEAAISRDVEIPISYGILQRIRGGVLIESYRLSAVANAFIGGTMTPEFRAETRSTQHVMLQVADDVKPQKLDPGVRDLAIALYFTPDDVSGEELRSKYIYLSDMGYTEIKPGQVVSFRFDLGGVEDVTGINVISLGKLDAALSSVYTYELSGTGELLRDWSIEEPIAATTRPARYTFYGQTRPVTLHLTTAADDGTVSSGTREPVRVSIGYYDKYGAVARAYYGNIRPYISSSGKGFVAGETDEVKLLIPGFDSLRWVEIEPWKEEADGSQTPATLKLSSLSVTVGVDGRAVTRALDQTIVEGEPLHVSLADVIMFGNVAITSGSAEVTGDERDETGNPIPVPMDEEDTLRRVNSGETMSRLLSSGGSIRIAPQIFGSEDGFTAKIENYDPTSDATDRANLVETHGYSAEYLTQLFTTATESAENGNSAEEREAAKQVVKIVSGMRKSYGTFNTENGRVSFTAPRNFTGRDQYYRITVSSRELPDVFFTVDVKVYSENDLLMNAVNLWKTEQANARPSTPAGNTILPEQPGDGETTSAGSETNTETGNTDTTTDTTTDDGGVRADG